MSLSAWTILLWTLELLTADSGAQRSIVAPDLVREETFSETFTTIADFEDGTYIQLQLAISNLGPGDAHGICKLLVVERGKEAWSAAGKVDREEWSHTQGPPEVLTIGQCKAIASDHFEMKAVLDQGSVRITLDARPQRIEPPEHHLPIGDGFYETDILVPFARATVEIDHVGRDRRMIVGHGYADHSRSATLPNKIGRMWIRFRGLADSHSALVLVRFPPGTESAHGYTWAQGRPAAVPLLRVKVQRSTKPERDRAYQWRALVETQDKLTWRLETSELIRRDAPIEEFAIIGKLLRPIIGDPVTYTYRAVLTDAASKLTLPGVLEAEVME
jgi:hypothetical protein